MVEEIYLGGECYGLYGLGSIIFAKRSEEPSVIQGVFYTIKIIERGVGTCGKNLVLKLEEVDGVYNRATFKVTKKCIDKKQASKS